MEACSVYCVFVCEFLWINYGKLPNKIHNIYSNCRMILSYIKKGNVRLMWIVYIPYALMMKLTLW